MKKILKICIPFIIVLVMVISYLQSIGQNINNQLVDHLLQKGGSTSGNIYLIEIDSHSLEELGPYQTWTRDYVAEAIETLNADPENKPAVIGVDVLYMGQTREEADEHLVQACRDGGNVVVGSLLDINSALREGEEGSYYMTDMITQYEEPFDDLKTVTKQGYVNGFPDKDGIIRHGLLETKIPDGEEVPSFSYQIYQQFAVKNQMEVNPDIPENQDGYWYLSYQAIPGGYSNEYSLSDLIQGEIPTDRLGDSIVLIGPYTEGLMDSYRTAVDYTTPMYGVEIHANMIDAMIAQDFKKEINPVFQAVLLGIVVLVICYACSKDKLRYGIIYMIVGCLGYLVIVYVCYQKGFLLNLIYIPIVSLIIPVLNIVDHYIKAIAQKRMVEKTFKKYVAPEVVDRIIKTGMDEIQLGGATLDIACLFVDIRGFTTMSEALTPEQVVEILNRYLELTSSCIFRHHGTLDKFIGDATMALFNAPLPQDDYVYQAVLTAWDMVKGAEELGKEMQERFGRTVSFGVGVHCGKAVVGNIGTERRMDYTAIGDTVNTSARLEANAPAGTVLLSQDVVNALEGRLEVESVGNIPLKGKSKPLEIFRLVCVKE